MWLIIDAHYLDRDERTWKQTQEMVNLEPNECPYYYKTIKPMFIASYLYSPLGLLQKIDESVGSELTGWTSMKKKLKME